MASDGHSLRVYQAIIDARTLLAEINCANRRKSNIGDAMSDMSSGHSTNVGGAEDEIKLQDKFKIVSTQSSARPGAIIELEAIADATQVYHIRVTFICLILKWSAEKY